jgi:RNA polymerase sigma factor (TIGR02999 family)
MAALSQPDVTTLLGLAVHGDQFAQSELFRRVESVLRKLAKARLRHEQPAHNLQTTVLVDEAFMKLVGDQEMIWENRAQFYCCAAKVMRQILVDDARRRAAKRRGGGERAVPLDTVPEPVERRALDPFTLLALHEALTKLAGAYPDLIQIVELHHFGGWDLQQIAEEILHLPYVTVKRRWQRAKAILHRALSGGADDA